jgi:hypothetical protein
LLMLPTRGRDRPAMPPKWNQGAVAKEAMEVETVVEAAAEATVGEVPPETETESFTME